MCHCLRLRSNVPCVRGLTDNGETIQNRENGARRGCGMRVDTRHPPREKKKRMMATQAIPDDCAVDDTAPRLVGCAGWSIASLTGSSFPAKGTHLERYAQVFDAVEINSSFYRPHRPQTYARWAASVPAHFRFSVKLPRAITHERHLTEIDVPLAQFATEVAALGDRLGCILAQLPPNLAFDQLVADAFFTRLHAYFPCTIACEARSPGWFDTSATTLLRRHRITRVIADPPTGQPGPHVPTTPGAYLRMHGAPQRYYSSYSDDYLDQLIVDMKTYTQAGRSIWCIFDNTASGAALANALSIVARPRIGTAALGLSPA